MFMFLRSGIVKPGGCLEDDEHILQWFGKSGNTTREQITVNIILSMQII